MRRLMVKKDRITVAWLCLSYSGKKPPMAGLLFGLDSERYRKICIYLKKPSDAPNCVEEYGCKPFYISRKKRFRIFNLAAIWKLSRVLRREQVDILHCFRHQAVVYGTFAAMIAKTPIILSHVLGLNRSKKARRRFINRIVLRRVSKILTVGEAVRDDVLKCNAVVRPDQVISLNNSIDYDKYAEVPLTREQIRKELGLDMDSFVVGTVGRLVPTKGQSCLIRAFAEVKKSMPASELVIVGDGSLKEALCREAGRAGLEKHVHFLGFRPDVERILKAMDVFVMPSVAEGMPGALLEAMAAGLPCIATSVGGIPEVLGHGRFGALVPPENENALAESMKKAAETIETSFSNMRKEAKRRVLEEYSNDVNTPRLENIYETEYKAVSQGN